MFVFFLSLVICVSISSIKCHKGPEPPCGLNFQYTAQNVDPRNLPPPEKASPRIINGDNAIPDEFPWMVTILRGKRTLDGKITYSHHCGGSIISQTVILTAAHCKSVFDSHSALIVAGCRKLTEIPKGHCQLRVIRKADLVAHPGYVPGAGKDIALIGLSQPLKLTNREGHAVGPICLVKENELTKGMAAVAGWGMTEKGKASNTLKAVDLNILHESACMYRRKGMKSSGFLQYKGKTEICAGFVRGKKDSCVGDSGGPLMVQRGAQVYQIGIVSYGPKDCGLVHDHPGVYAKVAAFRDWIDQNRPDGYKYNKYG